MRTLSFLLFFCLCLSGLCWGQDLAGGSVLFRNVNIFDGSSEKLLLKQNLLVEGNRIVKISGDPIASSAQTRVIEADGKTLIPGLIDAHVHMILGALSKADLMSPDINESMILSKAGDQAEKMLLRGFTSVRDVGGPSFALKAAIDQGKLVGPRIWPSGATVSQTAGHGDMRLPQERARRFFGEASRAEKYGLTFVADGTAEVLTAVRENLRFGASQIKVMAGGGTSSAYDPIDVTQYTLEEMKAAVDAAEDWGTYVTVHAYTPRAVRRAVEAGVKCVEHGQLLDESTLVFMREQGVWLSSQVLVDSTPDMDPARLEKRAPVLEGQQRLWPLAKSLGVKLAWGTDFLFDPDLNEQQNTYLVKLGRWFSPYETLKMVTHDNAQLLSLSGPRNPYPGKLGVVEEGALADLILVNGDPLQDLELISKPEEFVVIMKDGKVFKDLTQSASSSSPR
jgi:imidazolonepropionase-like amidohydrolase